MGRHKMGVSDREKCAVGRYVQGRVERERGVARNYGFQSISGTAFVE